MKPGNFQSHEKISVVLALDENYITHAAVTILSILKNAEQPSRFDFYLLEKGGVFSAENQVKLERIATRYKASLSFKVVDSDQLRNFKAGGVSSIHLTIATFYRILIPDLFPELSRCLYLDCDLVVLADLADLWAEDISSVAIGVVRDPIVEKQGKEKLPKHYDWRQQYPQIKNYFNAGVLYMNLRRWREKGYVQKCLNLAKNPNITEHFADQDVLNLVFVEDRCIFHPRWNIQTGQHNSPLLSAQEKREWAECLESPGIAHYTGEKKPWDYSLQHLYAAKYWEILNNIPWARASCFKYKRNMRRAQLELIKSKISMNFKKVLSVKVQPKKGNYRINFFKKNLLDVCGVPFKKAVSELLKNFFELSIKPKKKSYRVTLFGLKLIDTSKTPVVLQKKTKPDIARQMSCILRNKKLSDDRIFELLCKLFGRVVANKVADLHIDNNFRRAIFAYQPWFGFNMKALVEKAHACQWLLFIFRPRRMIIKRFEAKDLNQFHNIEHRGVRLYQVAQYDIALRLGIMPKELDLNLVSHRQAILDVYNEAISIIEEAIQYVEYFQPEMIVIAQGYELSSAILRYLAVCMGLRIVALENIFDKEKLLWEDVAGISVNKNLAQNYYWRYKESLPADLAESATKLYLQSINECKSDEHQSPKLNYVNRLFQEYPVITYLAQVGIDSSILFGLRNFESQIEIIILLTEFAAHNNVCLAIKLHPKEGPGYHNELPYYRYFTWEKLQKNQRFTDAFKACGSRIMIDYDNRYNTYDLIQQSKVCVTINSQAGLEALLHNKETILCGHAYYGNLGFTHEVFNQKDLNESLISIIKNESCLNISDEPKKFFYTYRELYCIPKTEASVVKLLRGHPDFLPVSNVRVKHEN